MHLNAYQKEASTTAIYPGKKSLMGLAYVALGANGEAGEIAEHVKKAWRDDEEREGGIYVVNTERRNKILKEVGDALWYLSQICEELDADFAVVARQNLMKLDDRRERSMISGEGDDR